MGKSSIYRTIKLFEELRVIQEVRPGQFDLTDIFKQHHHYFDCRLCGRQVTFNDQALEKALTRLTQRHQLALEDHHIRLIGLCTSCAATATPRTAIGNGIRRSPGA